MSEAGFIKRLFRSVVSPGARARADRRARNAVLLCQALLSERGEVSGAALAREALSAYRELPEPGLATFFDLLVSEFSPDPQRVIAASEAYRANPSPDHLIHLQREVEPPRQELFRRFNMAPGGTAALVAMRWHVLEALKSHPDWMVIDADLAHLFGSWFNRGFLTLQRIDWRTSAIVLEKLIQHEAVHEITGWKDLHRRLEADRRCFAFFHPALLEDPLIFIEVALTRGISASVQPLLDVSSPVANPAQADSAIFYSITNCQEGLRGISFGNLLIKQVVQELGREFPRVKTYATLSPVPGFRAWLKSMEEQLVGAVDSPALIGELRGLQDAEWFRRGGASERLRPLLMQLCAYYLLVARQEGLPVDPVARFHLGNGARLERLNWLADTSEQGMRRSAGLMVNYVYHLSEVENNHEAFVREHRVVASYGLKKLARKCPLARRAARPGKKRVASSIQ
ncbi:MAG: malonyl-CoA decarboxylase [Betaproteobacteria bacterium]|nr:malonyl-CoA decarboxylase [Betaproteobacteria bacterium]